MTTARHREAHQHVLGCLCARCEVRGDLDAMREQIAELTATVEAIKGQAAPDQRVWVSVGDAAKMMGCHPTTVWRRVRAGTLTMYDSDLGGRFRVDELRRYMEGESAPTPLPTRQKRV